MKYVIQNNELYHYGIRGQRWGIRRFQNENGTLTEEGRKRYGTGSINKIGRKFAKDLNKLDKDRATNLYRERRAANYGNKAKQSAYSKARKDTEKAINNLLAEAKKRKISLATKDVKRYGRTAEAQVAYFLAGVPGLLVSDLAGMALSGTSAMVKGTKYKRARK